MKSDQCRFFVRLFRAHLVGCHIIFRPGNYEEDVQCDHSGWEITYPVGLGAFSAHYLMFTDLVVVAQWAMHPT